MTAARRTLEEIAEIIERGFEPNFGWDELTHSVVHDLLAIAQGQREEIARLKLFETAVVDSEKALAELVKNHRMPGPVFENCDPGFLKK